MPIYQITYHTQNNYSSFIREAVLEFLVCPATLSYQKIEKIHFTSDPVSNYYTGKNMFGFDYVRFRLKNHKGNFNFTLISTVNNQKKNPFDFPVLTPEEEQKVITSDVYTIDNYLFLTKGKYTQIPADYLFPEKDKTESIFQFVNKINEFVHSEITYDTNIENPYRLVEETVNEKRGVCQDLTHLMIAVLRKNNIPSRYVSGYLNPGEGAVGAGAVHAWVEALIPGAGWIGFDPTNNLLEDHHYIKIAHGIDINDCTTLKGVIKGEGSNKTNYHVLVEEQNKEINQ